MEPVVADKSAASPAAAAPVSGVGQPTISSGSASAALIKAAEASSSEATEPTGAVGDTSTQGGPGKAAATAGATAKPVVDGSTGTKPAGSGGEAPEHRIEAAVKNARAATRLEVEKEFAAFKGLDPGEVQTSIALLRELRTDTAGFFKRLGERLKESGDTEDEAYPAADLVSKDGKLKTYSEETFQKALDIHGRRVANKIMQEIAPLREFVATEQQTREETTRTQQRRETISTALAEARQLKHFTKENEPAILEVLKAIPMEKRKALGPVASLHMAYNTFVESSVFPNIDTAAEQRVRESYAKKANAAGGNVHPTDQGGDPKKPVIRNQTQLARHMEHLEETMS